MDASSSEDLGEVAQADSSSRGDLPQRAALTKAHPTKGVAHYLTKHGHDAQLPSA
jgi:hypothetical protein